MRKVINEVKEFKPYITSKIVCFVVALITAFIVDYFPFTLGIDVLLWLLLFLLFFIYAYFICLGVYYVIIPADSRIKKADFDTFLINKGINIDSTKKRCKTKINPFKKTIRYTTRLKNGETAIYLFDTKNNTFESIKNIKKTNKSNDKS